MTEERETVSQAEAAVMLGKSVKAVRGMRQRGEVEAVKVKAKYGDEWRIYRDTLPEGLTDDRAGEDLRETLRARDEELQELRETLQVTDEELQELRDKLKDRDADVRVLEARAEERERLITTHELTIADLRSTRERLEVLFQNVTKALPPIEAEAQEIEATPEPQPRRSWWKRIFHG